MSDLVFARNCSIARMVPGEAELASELTGLPGRAKSVKPFERSNGPDIALYKKIPFNYLYDCLVLERPVSAVAAFRLRRPRTDYSAER